MIKDDRHAASAPPESSTGRRVAPEQDRAGSTDLSAELAEVSLLLGASTTALFVLDKNGLIVRVNPSATELLGAQESYLLKKPFGLFIVPEDQAIFYIHRSRIVAGAPPPPFEIRLKKKNGTLLSARIKAQSIDSPGNPLPGMLLAVDDITAYRQALEGLQFKADFTHLLISTIADLAAWSAAGIDDVITYALEKIGIVSGADRVYVCLFHEQKTRLTITHEWLGEGVVPPALKNQPVGAFAGVLKKLKRQRSVAIADVNALPPDEQAAHQGFHAAGAAAFFFTPLRFGRNLLGLIGCDAVRQPAGWSTETGQLVDCIGMAIAHALVRRQIEKAPADVHRRIFTLVETPAPAADNLIPEYDGPIVIVDAAAPAIATAADWRFVEAVPDDPSLVDTAFLKDGKTASLACNHCNRQRQLDISEIRIMGSQLKATCVCGHIKYVKIDLRREHRRAVSLRGVFMRGPGDRLALKSDDWGHIEVHNLSRRGIGFKALGKADLRVNDRFRVKFTLDNTAGSIIQKEVVVRSVVGEMIGCQFEGHEACDVTLGFYMMN